jgi:hypothetical protein
VTRRHIQDSIFSDPKFENWKSKVTATGVTLEEIDCVGTVIHEKVDTTLIHCYAHHTHS